MVTACEQHCFLKYDHQDWQSDNRVVKPVYDVVQCCNYVDFMQISCVKVINMNTALDIFGCVAYTSCTHCDYSCNPIRLQYCLASRPVGGTTFTWSRQNDVSYWDPGCSPSVCPVLRCSLTRLDVVNIQGRGWRLRAFGINGLTVVTKESPEAHARTPTTRDEF